MWLTKRAGLAGGGGMHVANRGEDTRPLWDKKKQKNYQQTAVLMLFNAAALPTPTPTPRTRTPQLQYCIVLGTLA